MTCSGRAAGPAPQQGELGLLGILLLIGGCTCDHGRPPTRNKAPLAATAHAGDGRQRNGAAAVLPQEQAPSASAPPVAAVRGPLRVKIEEISHAGFRVSWEPAPHATSYQVLLGPEPPDEHGRLAKFVRLEELKANERRFAVRGLAPNTHAFLVIRAQPSSTSSSSAQPNASEPGGPSNAEPASSPAQTKGDRESTPWGAVHVQTPRGPATPGGSLRSVHGMAPDVLALVVRQRDLAFDGSSLGGDRGRDWQAGAWELRRADDRSLPVARVQRHTVVAGQGNLPLGFDRHARATVHLEHRLYLRLGEPIGEREVLRIRHRGASGTELEVIAPFSDRYLETPVIQVNQVGYNPLARQRWAYLYGWLGDGGPLPLESFPRAAEVLIEPLDPLAPRSVALGPLPVRPRPSDLTDVGGQVRQIDLASLAPAEGVRYRVRLPGVGVSAATAVSREASFKAYYTILRGLFHNRWCGDLRPELTEWSRPPDHCSAYFVGGRTEGFFPQNTKRTAERPLRGGHHDAGDFDIRPLHVLVAQALLRAFELGGAARFGDGQLNLPESGNGIPDLLDEALWSLAAWEQLQEPDGGVRLGVESTRHPPGYYFAHEDALPYFAYDSDAAHTAYVAGLFAQASHLVAPYDAERSARLFDAARRAYRFARANDAPDTYLAYAASELARAEGGSSAAADFEGFWRATNVHGRGLFDDMQPWLKIYPGSLYVQHPAMSDFVMGYLQSEHAQPALRHRAVSELRRWADEAAKRFLDSPQPHRGGRSPGQRPDWGMETSQGRYLDGVYQALQLGGLTRVDRARYVDALSLAADAMLGCNPASLSYVTGLGSRSPEQILHLDSLAFQAARGLPPVPGIVVYGPVEHMPGAPYYAPLRAGFYPPFEQQPRALRHVDAAHAVNMSEFSVWESQAPAALLFAALLPDGQMPWPELAAGRPEHKSPLPPHREPAPKEQTAKAPATRP